MNNCYETVDFLKVPFSCCSFENILEVMDTSIKKRLMDNYISITNTESVYFATKLNNHLNYIKGARFSCCDGVGISMAARIIGKKIPRLHGPDLMLRSCAYGIDKRWRHFFYGGKIGVAEKLSDNLSNRFPGFITAGFFSPPFRPLTQAEDLSIISMISRSEADILWVSLGLLKQEKWIQEHLGKMEIPWMIGIGAAFDFYAGVIKRAPKIFRKIGLEWFYRVLSEPRMIIRNLRSLDIVLKGVLRGNKT
jgi:N-acetylglucosaminyldiphosphoundecaprenol N-acetyl-beta-D-mannosaminyltransferase